MYKKLIKPLSELEKLPVFSSIKRGLILLIPILMIGAISLMLRNFPIPAFQLWLDTPVGLPVLNTLLFIYDSTFGFLSAYLVLSISYYYASTLAVRNTTFQVQCMLVSFVCFIASFGGVTGSLQFSHFSTSGVFTAMISAIFATKIFHTLCTYFFKKFNFHIVAAEVDYRNVLVSIFPMILCIGVFITLNRVITLFFNSDNFNELISNSLVRLFEGMGAGLGAASLFTFLLNILWFFGMHGGNALDDVVKMVFTGANDGLIISKTFLDNFALIGGCGASICLVIALLVASRTKDNRRLSIISAPIALFNINEILILGLPVVLNPVMFIPFILVPMVSLLIGYCALMLGIIPSDLNSIAWTTPVFFSGYLATGTIWGAVVQGVIVAVGTSIYIPFVRLSERIAAEREISTIKSMEKTCQENLLTQSQYSFLDKNDEASIIAKSMINQLHYDMQHNLVPLYYQPQLDVLGNVIGAEALLRWRYKDILIFPPLVIALCHEDNFFDKLTLSIVKRVCSEVKEISSQTFDDIKISVNINSIELSNYKFISKIIDIAEDNLVAKNLCLEVTEESSIVYLPEIDNNIALLGKHNIRIAIDDFSMGQTSLKYLQKTGFSYVKLDGALVKQILDNFRSREIVSSIIELGTRLGFNVIAEFVETKEMLDLLSELGCTYMQGYLFSPALPPEDFVKFCNAYKNIQISNTNPTDVQQSKS